MRLLNRFINEQAIFQKETGESFGAKSLRKVSMPKLTKEIVREVEQMIELKRQRKEEKLK